MLKLILLPWDHRLLPCAKDPRAQFDILVDILIRTLAIIEDQLENRRRKFGKRIDEFDERCFCLRN